MKHDLARKRSHAIATKNEPVLDDTPADDDNQTPPQPDHQQSHHNHHQRQRHLARNRAAASKSRQRKRQWIEGLEDDLQQKEARNSMLRDTVDSLRRERALIKTMCLQHVDCDCDRIRRFMSASLDAQLAKLPTAQPGHPALRSGSITDTTLSSSMDSSVESGSPNTSLDQLSPILEDDGDCNPYSTSMWEKRIADGAIDIDPDLSYFMSEVMGY